MRLLRSSVNVALHGKVFDDINGRRIIDIESGLGYKERVHPANAE
jgi:hypothetical protein